MTTIDVISASAGTGKTSRLTRILADALLLPQPGHPVRPEGVVAVTYTRKAAAELRSRLRQSLMAAGAWDEAERVRDGYLGTIHAVCQRLLREFALEGGLSPDLMPVEATTGERLFREALADVLGAVDEQLEALGEQLELDWPAAVRSMIKAARDNGLGPAGLALSAERSVTGLLALLPSPHGDPEERDRRLVAELQRLQPTFTALVKDKTSSERAEALAEALAQARRGGGRIPWRTQVKVAGALGSSQKTRLLAEPLLELIADHLSHPRFQAELEGVIRGVFGLAAQALAVVEQHKRAARVVDYEDMLAGALTLLDRPEVRQALAGRLDLLLVDEFQDTSPLQLAILMRLAELAGRAFWVGDPKQAIFGFQGSDPELMAAATAHALAGRTPEILDRSYRSRPDLVVFCSELFARALAPHGIPAEQVRLVAGVPEPAGLAGVEVLEAWAFSSTPLQPGSRRETRPADGVAEGVAALLGEAPPVRQRPKEGESCWQVRPLRRGDIALLARTNDHCDQLAAALQQRGIPAQVGLSGLTSTPEGILVQAGLALLVDPQDGLAAAEIGWLAGAAAADPDAWLAGRIEEVGTWRAVREAAAAGTDGMPAHAPLAFAADPRVAVLRQAQREAASLCPSEAVELVIDALDLPGLCRGWSESARRLANLEALVAEARAYEELCLVRRRACTLAGLGQHLATLDEEADDQAKPGDPDAVQVLTLHSAKGLEWPVVVLCDLDSCSADDLFRLHAQGNPTGYVPGDPLQGRWLHWWPYPYGKLSKGVELRDRAAGCELARRLAVRERHERARLLYVGFTRARDRLILFARLGKDGARTEWLDELADAAGEPLLEFPWAAADGPGTVCIGGGNGSVYPCRVRTLHGVPHEGALVRPPVHWLVPRPGAARPPETIHPSGLEPGLPWSGGVSIGPVTLLAERIPLTLAGAAMDTFGRALHDFLASDPGPDAPPDERHALAQAQLSVHQLHGVVDPDRLPVAADALRRWAVARFGPLAGWHTEQPLRWSLTVDGHPRLLIGEADLVLDTAAGFVIVDHKSFPGDAAGRDEKVIEYAPQLAAYRAALESATGRPVVGLYLHFPVRGEVVEVLLG